MSCCEKVEKNQENEQTPKLIFTRYLYIKNEVEISLLSAILNKKNDESLFWAFELYYSGFTNDLLYLIWRIYFEFYATLNPTFEAFFLIKEKEAKEAIKENNIVDSIDDNNDTIMPVFIATIINNLLIRKYNTDVFFLREITMNLEMETPYMPLLECFSTNNYETIAHYIVETDDDDFKNQQKIVDVAQEYFTTKGLNMKLFKSWKKTSTSVNPVNSKLIILSRIMHYYTLLNKEIKIGKSLYINVEAENLITYKTKQISFNDPPNKILYLSTIYSPDTNYIVLFNNNYKRPENIMNYYEIDWLYYASFSPVWKERITLLGGTIDHKYKRIAFYEEEDEDTFFDNYNYNPEEQSPKVQQRNIPIIPDKNPINNWKEFYDKYKNNGLYIPGEDEMEALRF